MTTTYAQAKTPKTAAEIRALILAALTPSVVAGWSEHAPQRLLVEELATRMAEESSTRALLAQMIDLGELADLDRDWTAALLAWFDEEFIPALPARWDVPFVCAASAAPVTVGATTTMQIQASGGAIFLLEQPSDVVFSSLTSLTQTVRFVARVAGVGGNVAPSSISSGKILTGPAGLSLTHTPALFTAGRDEETPAAAIARCLGKWGTLGAGWTLTAFDYRIPQTLTVTGWLVRDDNPDGPGTTHVWIRNAAGAATGPEIASVQANLDGNSVRPLGSSTLTVESAVAHAISVTATLTVDGSNPSALANAAAAIETYLQSTFGVSGTVEPVLLEALLFGQPVKTVKVATASGFRSIVVNAPGFGGVTGVAMSLPAAPVVLAQDEFPDFTAVLS